MPTTNREAKVNTNNFIRHKITLFSCHQVITILLIMFQFNIEIPTSQAERKSYQVTKEMVIIKRYEKVLHVEEFVPSVVEPSFGIGRIMYALFEHR